MTTLEHALKVVKEHEGGFCDDAGDPGGATKYGISLRFLKDLGDEVADVDRDGDVDADDVRALSWEQAANIYVTHFWDRYHYGFLQEDVAVKVFDMAVNVGPKQAALVTQRALRACGIEVEEDGIFGKETWRAANAARPDQLVSAIRSELAGFYRMLTKIHPERSRFLAGWLNRAYE
jgi:lysozyme family protein